MNTNMGQIIFLMTFKFTNFLKSILNHFIDLIIIVSISISNLIMYSIYGILDLPLFNRKVIKLTDWKLVS